MNFAIANTSTPAELELELQAVIKDISFLEMLIPERRTSAMRNGAPPENSDEKQFIDALKRVVDLRERLKK